MFTRIARLVPLLAVLTLTACEDVLGPLTGTDVRIHGPSFVYGEMYRGGLTCSYIVTARTGGTNDDWRNVLNWTGGVVEMTSVRTGQVTRQTLSRDWVTYHFGGDGMRRDEQRDSREFRFTGPDDGEWTMRLTLTYYVTTGTGSSREASFDSACRR
jgi:hypothetical protein